MGHGVIIKAIARTAGSRRFRPAYCPERWRFSCQYFTQTNPTGTESVLHPPSVEDLHRCEESGILSACAQVSRHTCLCICPKKSLVDSSGCVSLRTTSGRLRPISSGRRQDTIHWKLSRCSTYCRTNQYSSFRGIVKSVSCSQKPRRRVRATHIVTISIQTPFPDLYPKLLRSTPPHTPA